VTLLTSWYGESTAMFDTSPLTLDQFQCGNFKKRVMKLIVPRLSGVL
jgi:hypothetical protein